MTKVNKQYASEYQEQSALVNWMNTIGLFFHSIPNGAKRSFYGHQKELSLGLYKGASDIFIAMPRNGYAGYYVEMKSKGKKPRLEQIKFMERARKEGYKAEWFDNWLLAKESIEIYLYGLHNGPDC